MPRDDDTPSAPVESVDADTDAGRASRDQERRETSGRDDASSGAARSASTSLRITALDVWGPALASSLVGCGATWLADGHPITLTLMLAVPVLWGLVALAVLVITALRRWRLLVRFVAAVLPFMIALHLPVLAPAGSPEPPPDADRLTACAHAIESERNPEESGARPLRILSWNTRGLGNPTPVADVAAPLAELDADILLLQEVRSEAAAVALADALEADVVWHRVVYSLGPAILSKRDALETCGGHRSWMVSLPSIDARAAGAAVAFAGGVPVVSMHLDRAREHGEIGKWSDMLSRSAARIAGLAELLGPRVVVAGDTNTSTRFHRFHATLAAGGLEPAESMRTWPARWGRDDVIPVYALDRIYVGRGWEVASATSERLPHSDHLAVIVDLEPVPDREMRP